MTLLTYTSLTLGTLILRIDEKLSGKYFFFLLRKFYHFISKDNQKEECNPVSINITVISLAKNNSDRSFIFLVIRGCHKDLFCDLLCYTSTSSLNMHQLTDRRI